MSEEQMENAIRSFLKATVNKDVQKALSFLSENVVWTAPQGTFKGSAEVRRYLNWMSQVTINPKVTEIGIGIMVQGNTGVIEHELSGFSDGMKWEIPAMCVYVFSGDKIQNIRSFYDRLYQVKQVAKGIIAKRAVNSVISAAEKGLH